MMRAVSGSGPFGAEAQMAWLGHPAQAADCPAVCDSGPGQCSGDGQIGFSTTLECTLVLPGSGATSFGAFNAKVKSCASCTASSTSEGAIWMSAVGSRGAFVG